jgi:hypothetical protein
LRQSAAQEEASQDVSTARGRDEDAQVISTQGRWGVLETGYSGSAAVWGRRKGRREEGRFRKKEDFGENSGSRRPASSEV